MAFGNMGTIWSSLGLDSTKFNQGMKLAESRVALAGRKMQTIGRKLTMGVSLPLMAVGVAATKAGMDFDDSMTKSLAIMRNITPQIRAEMEKTAKDVVKYTTFSAKEGADAYFYLASAGLDAAQSIKALPRVAKFAQAGQFDLARATDLLTDAQSALGLSVDDVAENMEKMTRVSDVLVKANTLSNATVEQFSESLTNKAGAALKLLNKDIEEGAAVLAVWADQGVKGAEAGNWLNIVFRDLQRAAIKGEEVFAEFGVSVFDTSGNVRNMADVIGDLENALDGMSDKEKRATLMMLGFQDRSISAMMTLLGTSDAIRSYEKDLRSASGYTDAVAKKQMESFAAQVKQLKNELVLLGIQIFDILRPQLEDLIEQVKRGIDWFDGLSDGQKKLAVNIGLVAAALGPALMMFGQLAVTIPRVTKAVMGLTAANRGLMGTLTSFTAVATGSILLAEGVDRLTAGMNKYGGAVLRSVIYPHSEALHGIKLNVEAIKGLKDGTLEWSDVLKMSRFDLEDWAKEHRKSGEAINDTTETIEEFIPSIYEEKKAMREAGKATGDTTKAMGNQEDAADDLMDSIDGLINSLFRLYNLNQSVIETTWNYEDALDNLDKIMGDVNSTEREKQEAMFDTQDAMEDLLNSIWEEYNAEGTSIQRKRELIDQMGNVISKADEMGIKLDEVAKDRITTMTFKGVIERGLSNAVSYYNSIRNKTVTITFKGRQIGAMGAYDKGGIVGHAQGGMVTPNLGGDIPIIAHKNEVVLNPQQQAKLLFEIAKGQNTGGGGTNRPIEIRNIIELDSAIVYEKMKKIDDFNRDRIVE